MMAVSTPMAAFAEGEIDLSEMNSTGSVTVSELVETNSSKLPEISETLMTEFTENEVMPAADGEGIQQMTTHTGYKYYHPLQGAEAN